MSYCLIVRCLIVCLSVACCLLSAVLLSAVYGGAYIFGDGYEFGLYDPTNLAKTQNVIVVAVNYRLLTFGFMALEELAKEAGGTTGNYGVQDQTVRAPYLFSSFVLLVLLLLLLRSCSCCVLT